MKKRLVTLLIVSAMLLSGCVNIEPEWDGESEGCEVTGEITETVPQTESGEKDPHSNVVEKDGLRFMSKGDGTCSVTAADDFTATAVVIPKVSPSGEAVVEIGKEAFFNSATLSSITIPSSVNTIEESAFRNCGNLSKIVISEGVTKIEDFAFSCCTNLIEVTLPQTVTHIGNYAFNECSKLARVTIPSSVTDLGNFAFYETGLTSVCIPGNIKWLRSYTFANCTSLASVTIENGVENIGDFAFEGCSVLKSIHFPRSMIYVWGEAIYGCDELSRITVESGNTKYHVSENCLIETNSKKLVLGCKTSVIPTDGSVTSIGYGAFFGCNGLTEIVIPEGVTSIGTRAFQDCKNLKNVTLPNSLKTIQEHAFYYCTGLTEITVPNGVTDIDDYAFAGCRALTRVSLPNTLTNFKHYLFAGCKSLEEITVESGGIYHSSGNCVIETASKTVVFGTDSCVIPSDGSVTCIGPYAFQSRYELTDFQIPQGVLQIGTAAFRGCEFLQTVTISNSVTMIDRGAFLDCSALTDIYFEGTVAEWRAIEKEYDWCRYGNHIIVHCTNGQDLAWYDGK